MKCAAVRLDQVMGDGQADAAAARGPRTRFVNAVEAVEHVRQMLGRNTDARVGHGDLDLFTAAPRRHYDAATRRRGLERIAHQVEQHLAEPVLIANNRRQIGGHIRPQAYALLVKLAP